MGRRAENGLQETLFCENVVVNSEKFEVRFVRYSGVTPSTTIVRKTEDGQEEQVNCLGTKGKILAHAKVYGNYQNQRKVE
jgi:hypothetical protein